MNKLYQMDECVNVANIGTKIISNYLLSRDNTIKLINVEKDKKFQSIDIDLLLISNVDNNVELSTIEIKVDTYDTGNYFFETISNMNKNTDGCFLYSQAKWLYYYFLNTDELHIFEFSNIRLYLKDNYKRFESKKPLTTCGDIPYYNSFGYIVPITTIKNELKKVFIIKGLKQYE
ncbi:MAG: hypothetical protein ACM3O3_12565 [Syntrophothermus sp.]